MDTLQVLELYMGVQVKGLEEQAIYERSEANSQLPLLVFARNRLEEVLMLERCLPVRLK